jgi:hypothetical protein
MLRDRLVARLAEMGPAPDYSRLVADVLGIRGVQPALARRLIEQALVVGDRRGEWRRVGDRAREQAPSTPGVYVFRDAGGRALYVGKATNLRRRLGAHFALRRWRALGPEMARVAAVEWEEAGSEVEALVREAALIRALQPAANVQIGRPLLDTRAVPHALVRDVVLLVPSVNPEAAELVAARNAGDVLMMRARRDGRGLAARARQLWEFFRGHLPETSETALAPIVFSWLAGRGKRTTRLDPHEATSASGLRRLLATLLDDRDLFTERLMAMRH